MTLPLNYCKYCASVLPSFHRDIHAIMDTDTTEIYYVYKCVLCGKENNVEVYKKGFDE